MIYDQKKEREREKRKIFSADDTFAKIDTEK